LGIGIANLINIFNPELIAIGAGVSDAEDLLLDPLKTHTEGKGPFNNLSIWRRLEPPLLMSLEVLLEKQSLY